MRDKVIKGLSWNAIASVVNQASNYVIGIVLARLLDPSTFGLIAMVMVVIGFAEIFRDIGFSPALIQKQNVTEKHESTVFWLNIAMGIGLVAMFLILAPYIADFYDEPILSKLIRIIAFSFLIRSMYMVHNVLLVKSINFQEIAIISICSSVISGVIAVVLAYHDYGVWSLVWKNMISTCIALVLYWVMSPWKPKFFFSYEIVKDMLGFGLNITGTQILSYWAQKVDDLIIGKTLGAASLGLYSRAFNIMMLPWQAIQSQFSSVLYPMFSDIQDDIPKQNTIYLKFTGMVQIIIIPMMLGLFAVSEEFVLFLLGQKWESIIPLVQVFSIATIFQSLGFPRIILMTHNLTKLLFHLTLVTRVIRIGLIVIGIYLGGIMGVSIGITIAILVNTFIMNVYAVRQIEMNFLSIIKVILPFFMASLFMLAVLSVLDYFISDYLSIFYLLLLKVIFGIVLYITVLIIIKPFPTIEVWEVLKSLYRNKFKE